MPRSQNNTPPLPARSTHSTAAPYSDPRDNADVYTAPIETHHAYENVDRGTGVHESSTDDPGIETEAYEPWSSQFVGVGDDDAQNDNNAQSRTLTSSSRATVRGQAAQHRLGAENTQHEQSSVTRATVRGHAAQHRWGTENTQHEQSSVTLDSFIEARTQRKIQRGGYGVLSVVLLIALILGGVGVNRVATITSQVSEMQAAHSGLETAHGTLQTAHSALQESHGALQTAHDTEMAALKTTLSGLASQLAGHVSQLDEHDAWIKAQNATLAGHTTQLAGHESQLDDHSTWIKEQNTSAVLAQSTGLSVPVVDIETMPPCNAASASASALIYMHDAALEMDVLQSCSAKAGVVKWHPVVMLGGVIVDTAVPSEMLSAVASGLPGLYLLRLEEAGNVYAIDAALWTVHSHQDVRIVSTVSKSDQKVELAFNRMFRVQEGGSLTVSGHVAVTAGQGLWSCTIARLVQGSCTLKDGVTVQDETGVAFSVEGTLPGKWTRSNGVGTSAGAVSRSAATGLTTWQSDNWLLAIKDVYLSYHTPGKVDVVNKLGKRFVLFLMDAYLPSYSGSGFSAYEAVCEKAGLKMVISGYSTYYETQCAGKSNVCMPLVDGTDGNGQYWGSTNPEAYLPAITGWANFALLYHTSSQVLTSDGTGSFSAGTKRPICGIEVE